MHEPIETNVTINVQSLFPLNVTIANVNFQLNIDGSWTGDLIAVREAMAELKMFDGQFGIMLWLLYRELERDSKGFGKHGN
jgi:hypothetical protein